MALENVQWVNPVVIDGRTWAQKAGSFEEHWWWVEKAERVGNANIGDWEHVHYINLEEFERVGIVVLEYKTAAAKVLLKRVQKERFRQQVKADKRRVQMERPSYNKTWFG